MPRAIAVINYGNEVIVAAFNGVPTEISAMLLQLEVSAPATPRPQLVVIDVGNETSRGTALSLIPLDTESKALYVGLSMEVFAITTESSLVPISLSYVELQAVGPLIIGDYVSSTTEISGTMMSLKEAYGNVLLLGVKYVLDNGGYKQEFSQVCD